MYLLVIYQLPTSFEEPFEHLKRNELLSIHWLFSKEHLICEPLPQHYSGMFWYEYVRGGVELWGQPKTTR